MHRFNKQYHIVVGTAVSDRCMAKTQTLRRLFCQHTGAANNDATAIQHFAKSCVVRAIPRSKHLTTRTCRSTLLVEQLRPNVCYQEIRRAVSGALFLLHQRADDQSLSLNGRQVQRLPIEFLGTSRFDLLLEFQNQEEQLSGLLEYSTDLFDGDTIRRMAENCRTLLKGIVEIAGYALPHRLEILGPAGAP